MGSVRGISCAGAGELELSSQLAFGAYLYMEEQGLDGRKWTDLVGFPRRRREMVVKTKWAVDLCCGFLVPGGFVKLLSIVLRLHARGLD